MRFISALQSAGFTAPLLGILGGFGVIALQSLRWWVVIRPIPRIRYRDAFEAFLVGGFMNAVLPAPVGDLLRIRHLSDRSQVDRATLAGTALVDFWADKCGWLPAFALVALTGSPPSWMYRVLGFVCALAVVLLGGVLLLPRRLLDADRADGWRARFVRALRANSPARLAGTTLILGAMPWLWEAAAIGRVAASAGIQLPTLTAFVLLTAFNIAMIVPIPGRFGAHEAATTAVLMSQGASLERAIAFAIVYHASQLAPYLLGGGFALLRWRRSAVALGERARAS